MNKRYIIQKKKDKMFICSLNTEQLNFCNDVNSAHLFKSKEEALIFLEEASFHKDFFTLCKVKFKLRVMSWKKTKNKLK